MSAGLSWYNKISHVLASLDVPIENGVANAYVDGTTMKNTGYELAISVTPVRTKDFTWSLSFNTSKVKNTIRNNERKIHVMIISMERLLLMGKNTDFLWVCI